MTDQQTRRELLADAARVVIGAQTGSTAMVQRKLRVTFATAAELMKELERYDVIGPPTGTKPHDVLAAPDQLGEILDQIRGVA